MTIVHFASIFASVAQVAVAVVISVLAFGFYRAANMTTGNMIKAHDSMRQAFDNMNAAFMHQEKALDNLTGWVVPPDEWSEVIELQKTLQGYGSEERDYIIWCAHHDGYWQQGDQGYNRDVRFAKRFSAYEGLLIVLDRARNADPHDCYTLVAVGKPEQ